jgi:integrase
MESMAVYKKLTCTSCGKVSHVGKDPKRVAPCPCGGSRTYSARWYVSASTLQPDGRIKKVVRAVHTSRRVAEDFEIKLKNSRIEGEVYARKAPKFLFEDAASMFLSFCQNQVSEGRLGEKTLEFYGARVSGNLMPVFMGLDVSNISRESIEAYKSRRMSLVSPASVNRELATLKRLFSVMVELGRMKDNPAEKVKLLRENNTRERSLTKGEQARLMECCGSEHLRRLVIIALDTGLRLDGCLTLRWEEVDFKKNEIRKIVKGRKEVRIPMTMGLRKELMRRPGISGLVTPSTVNPRKPFCRTSDIGFGDACKKAGIEDFTFHDLRHTFATRFIEATRDIHTLAKIMGHSTTYMTERYAHLTDETAAERMRDFEAGR